MEEYGTSDGVLIVERHRPSRSDDERHGGTVGLRHREEELALRFASAAEYWDPDASAHVRRIGLYSASVALKCGWDVERAENLRIAAMLHDVGNVAVPAEILRKPGSLTPDEFQTVKTHTVVGARILEGSEAPMVALAAEIALSHHERWNGSGYPRRLKAEQISEAARIVSLVDAYDALSEVRPYKSAFPESEVIDTIVTASGVYFDPEVVQSFLEALPELRQIRNSVSRSIPISGV